MQVFVQAVEGQPLECGGEVKVEVLLDVAVTGSVFVSRLAVDLNVNVHGQSVPFTPLTLPQANTALARQPLFRSPHSALQYSSLARKHYIAAESPQTPPHPAPEPTSTAGATLQPIATSPTRIAHRRTTSWLAHGTTTFL
jgi:hypothetical protein